MAGAHEWVDRLIEATGWREPPSPCDWAVIEAAFVTPFPSDYKEMCDRFGPGDFCLWVLARPGWGPQPYITALGGEGRQTLLRWKDTYTGNQRLIALYHNYAESCTNGLIYWGLSEWGRYFWLADAAQAPEAWPVLATLGHGFDEPWYRFDIGCPRVAVPDPHRRPLGRTLRGARHENPARLRTLATHGPALSPVHDAPGHCMPGGGP